MEFGFNSLWMMNGSNLVRVDASNNTFIDIKIEGATGRVRGIAAGEGAVSIPTLAVRRFTNSIRRPTKWCKELGRRWSAQKEPSASAKTQCGL